MMRRLSLLIGAFAMTAAAGAADAGHAHFSAGGGFHVGGGGVHAYGGASVHWSSSPRWGYGSGYSTYRPGRWWGGGHVYYGYGYGYGGYYPWWPSYYYYYPEYVPSYYGASYYPVAPAYSAPGVAAAYVPPPPLPRFGVGLFGGAVSSDNNDATNTKETDFGLLARFRLTDGLLVEGELGKTQFNVNGVDNVRVDRRLGGSLVYEIGARNALAPYVLGGLGVNQSDVGGNYNTTQDYVEVGGGLRLALSQNIHLTADIRAGSRSTVSNDQTMPTNVTARSVAPPPTMANTNEDYTRFRLAAILYF
jgi:hypothetical protein